jgi:hypothetical protein
MINNDILSEGLYPAAWELGQATLALKFAARTSSGTYCLEQVGYKGSTYFQSMHPWAENFRG